MPVDNRAMARGECSASQCGGFYSVCYSLSDVSALQLIATAERYQMDPYLHLPLWNPLDWPQVATSQFTVRPMLLSLNHTTCFNTMSAAPPAITLLVPTSVLRPLKVPCAPILGPPLPSSPPFLQSPHTLDCRLLTPGLPMTAGCISTQLIGPRPQTVAAVLQGMQRRCASLPRLRHHKTAASRPLGEHLLSMSHLL